MVTLHAILAAINAHKNRTLLFAQAALPEHQFRAFKTLFLDEFGQKGLEKELARLYAEENQLGRKWNGLE